MHLIYICIYIYIYIYLCVYIHIYYFIKRIIEGKRKEGIQVRVKQERRRKKLVDD
jgi:hypothetical protein